MSGTTLCYYVTAKVKAFCYPLSSECILTHLLQQGTRPSHSSFPAEAGLATLNVSQKDKRGETFSKNMMSVFLFSFLFVFGTQVEYFYHHHKAFYIQTILFSNSQLDVHLIEGKFNSPYLQKNNLHLSFIVKGCLLHGLQPK